MADLDDLVWDDLPEEELDWSERVASDRNLNPEVARSALAAANRQRSEALAHIVFGVATVDDVIASAASNRAMWKLKLHQVLGAQADWQPRHVERLLNRLVHITGGNPSRITLGWLLDGRTQGRRFQAWQDVRRSRETPWVGFPYGVPA